MLGGKLLFLNRVNTAYTHIGMFMVLHLGCLQRCVVRFRHEEGELHSEVYRCHKIFTQLAAIISGCPFGNKYLKSRNDILDVIPAEHFTSI